MKHLIFSLLFSMSCLLSYSQESAEVVTRNYCTEIGRFDFIFYGEEVSGSYLLIPKNQLGAIWGRLTGLELKGRWVDADGVGDIIITFSEDFSFFRADYRSDEHPEKWYRDSWHGALRPNAEVSFSYMGQTYRCE